MTLVSVIIISTMAVSTAVSMALLGSATAVISNTYGRIAQSRALADTCAEVALEYLALDPAYTTDERGLDFPDVNNGWCVYTVEAATGSGGEEQRVIKSTASVYDTYARYLITVTVGPIESYPVPTVASWIPVAAF
jgi:hypothetical protein